MASTIKGIKTSDNIVHKIDGAALAYEKACTTNTDIMKIIVALTLGSDFSNVSGGAPLTFIYKEYEDQEREIYEPVEQILKAHKIEGEANSLYFSPSFSDNNFTITQSDVASADNFCICFQSTIDSNYVTSGTYSSNIEYGSEGDFVLVTDCLTMNMATKIYETFGESGSSFFLRTNKDFILYVSDNHPEFLPAGVSI